MWNIFLIKLLKCFKNIDLISKVENWDSEKLTTNSIKPQSASRRARICPHNFPSFKFNANSRSPAGEDPGQGFGKGASWGPMPRSEGTHVLLILPGSCYLFRAIKLWPRQQLDSYYTPCSCGLEVVQVLKEQTQVWGQS